MRLLLHSFSEALVSLRRERRRLLPMALGIVWGMASVMVLLAVATGFEATQRRVLAAYGDNFVLVRLNRKELDRAAGSDEPRLMMDSLDVERLRNGAPAIRYLSPMNNAYRARITGLNGAGSSVWVTGCLPEVTKIRNMPLAEGRFYNEIEESARRRVIVLGPQARRQLFGVGPAVGNKVRIAGFSTSVVPSRDSETLSEPLGLARASDVLQRSGVARPAPATASTERDYQARQSSSYADRDLNIAGELFEVIGVLKDVEIQRESYVSIARMAFIPFSTSTVVFDPEFNTIYLQPRSIADHGVALQQFRQVMGARYGFDPDDRNAVLVYFDAIERARVIAAIFGGFRIFLSAVGALILAIGGIGVMNVVLVSVAQRRFEIGLRKALGATPFAIYLQFFVETVLGCLLSGGVGFLLGAAGIGLLAAISLPEGFARPVLDLQTGGVAFALLAAIALVVGLVPARRASLLPPVEALRTG